MKIIMLIILITSLPFDSNSTKNELKMQDFVNEIIENCLYSPNLDFESFIYQLNPILDFESIKFEEIKPVEIDNLYQYNRKGYNYSNNLIKSSGYDNPILAKNTSSKSFLKHRIKHRIKHHKRQGKGSHIGKVNPEPY
jgi:hypothetical protein